MKDYFLFLWRALKVSLQGGWGYYLWMGMLAVLSLIGLNAYAKQFVAGLESTGLTDQVSWGAYIANFTFLVGVAAAAVMLVIPAYVYKNKAMHEVVLFGELMAIAVIVMCLLFVTVLTPHTSHLTPHTSHVIPHTSHVTRHWQKRFRVGGEDAGR